jgi:hypothetical protein
MTSPGPLFWAKPLLLGSVPPLLVSLLVLALTRRRRTASGEPPWGGALAIGGGYLVGHTALRGWPPVPPLERVDWLWYLTVAAVAVGTLEAFVSSRAWLGWSLRAPLGAAVLVLLLLPLLKTWGRGETVAWLAGLGAAGLVFWAALDSLAEPGPGAPLLLAVLALATAVVLLLSGSALLAQLGLAVAASLAGLLAVAWWVPPARGAATVAGVLLPGLWLLGSFYSDVPAASAVLLAAALPAAALTQVQPVRKRLRPWQALSVGLLVVLAFVTAAVAVAYRALPSDPYG